VQSVTDPFGRTSYRSSGYSFPLRAFSEQEAAGLCELFLTYWARHREMMSGKAPRELASLLIDTHLFLRWVYGMVSHPRVLDAVAAVLGPNLMVWSSQWFPKFPHDRSYVSWHQDAAYWGLTPANVTTAWIALTHSTPANGCLRVMPGSHRAPPLPQRETYAQMNMLSRGQEIAVEVDESRAVDLTLNPGQFSLHHVGIAHGSGANDSDEPRIGLAVRYISPDVVQRGNARDIVLLVRGSDVHGHFDVVQPPERDLGWGESAAHVEALARKTQNLMPAGVGPASEREPGREDRGTS
jgi:ectoine hydroxylase-related dioxygenase (phytanoyl-CoA dioxygenase family)